MIYTTSGQDYLNSLQIDLIRGDEWVKITIELSTMKADVMLL
jgi:hypothetical protein